MLGPIVQRKRVWQHDVPPQTLAQWQEKMDIIKQRWGKYFTDPEQFEAFAMLPLSEKQRSVVMNGLLEQARLKQEVDTCTGVPDSSPEHRLLCIPCVLKHPPTPTVPKK